MRPFLQPCARAIPAFRTYLFRSAGTLSSPELNDSLRRHIDDRKASFVPVLEQWKKQGNQLNPSDLRSIIDTLRESERFPQALKVSEWMSKQKACNLIPEDLVARLNLIDNVLGLKKAEKFFESIPEYKRDHSVYTTILSFYARSEKTMDRYQPILSFCARSEKTMDKAESIFRKMRELGYLSKPCPFNHMMSLYIQLDKRDMVHKILRQMEENNVEPDNRTLNIKLRLYAAESNIYTMENLLAECDTNTLDWLTSCYIATAYLKHRLAVKAVEMLRRAEQSVDPKSKELAYKYLMVLYGKAGNAEEVCRIWDLYKDVGWIKSKSNHDYRSVLRILLELNHIDGAAKIVKEWCYMFHVYDAQIVDMMASAYCERGQLKDAEALMLLGMAARDANAIMVFLFVSAFVAAVYILHTLAILVKFILKMVFDAITM